MSQKQGAFAEYITIPREALAAKSDDVPYHVAAATPTVALTSLQSLRDLGRLSEGGKALIIGAGGGIGSVALRHHDAKWGLGHWHGACAVFFQALLLRTGRL
jgi:NADPH:quinone reductase-like Zn-dependent oxidoreductase